MSLTVTKTIAIIVIAVVGALGCSSPMFLGQGRKYSAKFVHYLGFIQQCLMGIGAGVVVSTALLHILPDAIESFVDSNLGSIDYPWAFLFSLIGLYVIYVIESEMHNITSHANEGVYKTHLIEASIAIHSILIGIAFGTNEDSGIVKSLFIALTFHQLCEGMSIGPLIYQNTRSLLHSIVLVAIFALTTPLGIVIGLIIQSFGDPENPTSFLLQGIFNGTASGFLLYAGCVEFLSQLMHNDIEHQLDEIEHKSTCHSKSNSADRNGPLCIKKVNPFLQLGVAAADRFENEAPHQRDVPSNISSTNSYCGETAVGNDTSGDPNLNFHPNFVQTWGSNNVNASEIRPIDSVISIQEGSNEKKIPEKSENSNNTGENKISNVLSPVDITRLKKDFLSLHPLACRICTYICVLVGAAIMSVIAIWA